MKSMKKISITLTLITLFINTFCQPDHLVPAENIFQENVIIANYYMKLKELMIDSIEGVTEMQFIELPAWGPESVLIISRLDDDIYSINYRKPNQNLWYPHLENWQNNSNEKKANIFIYKFDKFIDKGSVEILKGLYKSAIMDAKFEITDKWRPDVTNYYFTLSIQGNMYTGKTKSPKKESELYELISINKHLIDLIENDSIRTITFNDNLIERVKQLDDRLTIANSK
jgi:hypothetical protein